MKFFIYALTKTIRGFHGRTLLLGWFYGGNASLHSKLFKHLKYFLLLLLLLCNPSFAVKYYWSGSPTGGEKTPLEAWNSYYAHTGDFVIRSTQGMTINSTTEVLFHWTRNDGRQLSFVATRRSCPPDDDSKCIDLPDENEQICQDGLYSFQYNNTCDRPENMQVCEDGEIMTNFGICSYSDGDNFSPEPELFSDDNQLTCDDYESCLEKLDNETGCSASDSRFFKFVDTTNFTYECIPSVANNVDDPITCNPDLTTCSKTTTNNQDLQNLVDSPYNDASDPAYIEYSGNTGGGNGGGDGSGDGGTGTNIDYSSNLTSIENKLDDIIANTEKEEFNPTANQYPTTTDVFNHFYSRINNAPITSAMNSFATIIPEGGSCNPLTFDLTDTIIGTSYSTDILCDLSELMRPVLSTVMLILYSIAAFRIFASA